MEAKIKIPWLCANTARAKTRNWKGSQVMKDQNRIRFNGSATPAGNQVDGNCKEMEMFEPTVKLDRALRALSAPERKKAIDGILKVVTPFLSETNDVGLNKFSELAIQSKAGASAIPGQAKSPKPGKGWIAVNCSPWTEAHFRKIARAAGMQFRNFCEFALHHAAFELEKQLGLSFNEASALSTEQIARLYKRSRLVRSIRSNFRPELS